jgi:hypothetical protein
MDEGGAVHTLIPLAAHRWSDLAGVRAGDVFGVDDLCKSDTRLGQISSISIVNVWVHLRD